MNQKQSVERRRKAVMEEAQSRGYEAVVFFNEVIRQNPSITDYNKYLKMKKSLNLK